MWLAAYIDNVYWLVEQKMSFGTTERRVFSNMINVFLTRAKKAGYQHYSGAVILMNIKLYQRQINLFAFYFCYIANISHLGEISTASYYVCMPNGGFKVRQNKLLGLILNLKHLNNNAIGYGFPRNIFK